MNRASILKVDGRKKKRETILREDIFVIKKENCKTFPFELLLPIVEKLLRLRIWIPILRIRTTPFNSIRDKRHDVHGWREKEKERGGGEGSFNDFLRMSVFHGSVLNL